MRSIINHQVYDTETAEEIARGEDRDPRSRLHWREEILYRTPKGAFFLHCQGGAASLYAMADGDTLRPGEFLETQDRDEVLEWLSNWGTSRLITKLFGDEITTA